jgi:hypothetical protein
MVIEVDELGGVEPGGAWAFFADGVLLNIVAALERQEMAGLTTGRLGSDDRLRRRR